MPEDRPGRIAELLRAHGGDMHRRAQRLLGATGEAEDVVQEVVVSLLEAPHLLAGVERLGGWLMTLVRRRCIDLLRRATRRRERGVADDRLASDDEHGPEQAAREELLEALAAALAALPDELRLVVIENELDGRPYREIAERHGVPMGTLMARKQRALAALREHLDRFGLEPPQ